MGLVVVNNRVYISGPVSCVSNPSNSFKQAENRLRQLDLIPINPIAVNEILPNGTSYDEYMIVDLALLRTCDIIYMLSGWRESDGARIEFLDSIQRGMAVMFEEYGD